MSENRRFRRKNRAKLSQSVQLATFFFQKTTAFVEKWKTLIDFYIIKIRISITFMHLRSKLTSEMYQTIGSLDEKSAQNRLKVTTFPLYFYLFIYLFFQKKLPKWAPWDDFALFSRLNRSISNQFLKSVLIVNA